jgi:hypothetical protein
MRLGAILAVLVLVGCGSGKRAVFPVHGQVTFENKPVANALVTFQPLDGPELERSSQSILTEEDGSFAATTYAKGDGLPVGKYAVTVTWLVAPRGSKATGEEDMVRVNQLPQRYSRPESSGLQITVEPRPNELEPFHLTR